MEFKKATLIYLFLCLITAGPFANNGDPVLTPGAKDKAVVAYCQPEETHNWNNYITGVTFGDISNYNQADKKSDNFPIRGVGVYTSQSTDIDAGNTYPITVTVRHKDINGVEEGYLRVWIDYNRDDDYDDPGELVIDHTETISENDGQYYDITKNIVVPTNVTDGVSQMRIVIARDAVVASPCPTSSIEGEFEEYGVVISNGVDTDEPVPVLSTSNTTVSGPFTVNVDFNEPITGLTIDDLTVSNGTASNLQGSAASYTVEVAPNNVGTVGIQLPADKVEDATGFLNTVSNILNVEYSINPPEVYCVPGETDPLDNYILGVNFQEIENSPQTSDKKSYSSTPRGTHDYTDLTATVEVGMAYDIELTSIMKYWSNDPDFVGNVRVWIDFNRDGDFDEANELSIDRNVVLLDDTPNNEYTLNETINIPANAIVGNTLMRILASRSPDTPGSCEGSGLIGEYENYSLNIVPLGATENPDFDIVWKKCPANIIVNSDTQYRKLYDTPYEYFRGCNTLEAGEDGWIEFTLLDDVKSNGDWFYIGLIEQDKIINNTGTTDPNFLFAIRSDTEILNDNILVLEGVNSAELIASGGNQGEVFRIERSNGVVKYYKDNLEIHTHVPNGTDPDDLILEPVFYILKPGTDNLVNVDFDVSESLDCEEFEIDGHYTKQEATPSSGGAIDLDIRGGQPPYLFEWSSPSLIGSNPVNVPAGPYTVTVTDSGGDSKSEEIDIYTMHDIEWETVEDGVEQTGDTYILKSVTKNELFSCNVIDANSTALIKIRLNEDIIPTNTPPYNEFNVFFKDTEVRTDALGKYGFSFNIYSSVLLVDDQQYNDGSPQVFGPDLNYNSKEYEYTIQLKNREVSFFKNQKFLFKAPILAEIENLRVEFNLLSSEMDGVDVDIQVSDECLPTPNTAQFTDLKRQLDGTYVNVDDDYIRFRYNEDYAVIDGSESNLICKVFDWHRTELYNISMNKEYGVNWKELFLPNGLLTEGQYYILEVHNANKDDIYFLRFKY